MEIPRPLLRLKQRKTMFPQLKAAAPQIADVGITPLSALRPGTKVNFIVSGTFPSSTTYVWDFGDSSPLSNGVSAKHVFEAGYVHGQSDGNRREQPEERRDAISHDCPKSAASHQWRCKHWGKWTWQRF